MKKRISIFLAGMLLVSIAFTGCSNTNTDSEESAAAGNTTNTEIAESSPDGSSAAETDNANSDSGESTQLGNTYSTLNTDGLEFGVEVTDYLSSWGSLAETLDTIQPMLIASAAAMYDTQIDFFYADYDELDPEFSWAAIYYLINDYEFERDGITQENGNLYVTAEAMRNFFGDLFYADTIPEISESMADLVSYDESTDTYVLIATGGGGIFYKLNNITISSTSSAEDSTRSAVITLDLMDMNNEILTSISVEIIHALSSNYLYAVQEVYPADTNS